VTFYEVSVNGQLQKIKVLGENGDFFNVEVNGKTVRMRLKNSVNARNYVLEFDGEIFHAEVEKASNGVLMVKSAGKTFEAQCRRIFHEQPAIMSHTSKTITAKKTTNNLRSEKGVVAAPIAGRIMMLKKSVGEEVKKGECLCILEAMKMENEIAALDSGILKEIRIREGAIVNKGDVLAIIE